MRSIITAIYTLCFISAIDAKVNLPASSSRSRNMFEIFAVINATYSSEPTLLSAVIYNFLNCIIIALSDASILGAFENKKKTHYEDATAICTFCIVYLIAGISDDI